MTEAVIYPMIVENAELVDNQRWEQVGVSVVSGDIGN